MAGIKGRGGRPRLTAAEHQMRGNYRADRHGPLPDLDVPDIIPPVPHEDVMPPPDLNRAERAIWAYYAPLLASSRLLTPADRDTLADYCRACAAASSRHRRLERALQKRPLDKQTVRLLDSQLRGWIDKKMRLADELGLSASSRMRLKWTGHQQRPAPKQPETPRSTLSRLQEQAAELRRPVGVK